MRERFGTVLPLVLAVALAIQPQTAAPKPADPLTPVRTHLPAATFGPPHTHAVLQSDAAAHQADRPIPYYTPPFVPPGGRLPALPHS